MKPSICLIVGDNRTEHCGVKDYAGRLAKALDTIGLSVEVLAPAHWTLRSFLRFRETLKQRRFDILHLQYPSIGNRKSLCPHIVGVMTPAKAVIVTLHEYSAMPRLQRASTHLFRWTADQLLFTAPIELMRYGSSGVAQRVIHIGSNVPTYPVDLPRAPTVLYFGQIRPQKGLEEFLELARRGLYLGKAFKYQVIGSVPERRTSYYEALRADAAPGVEWLIDLPFGQVAQLMAGSLAAYLPFPDGASYRRGSLLAALANGLPTITTVDSSTPRDMIDVVLPACGPGDALAHIERLYGSPDEVSVRGAAERKFSERFSWAEIARQHEQVYNEVLLRSKLPCQDSDRCAVQ